MQFEKFDKIPRLSRDIIITEKIDGTNAQIYIVTQDELMDNMMVNLALVDKIKLAEKDNLYIFAGSRTRWLDTTSQGDNFGFAKWVQANAEKLLELGEGRHYGEWYGRGIQRGYGLDEKRFALFNVGRWAKFDELIGDADKRTHCPACCEVVPIVAEGMFTTDLIESSLQCLKDNGSFAVLGFMKPEGLVIFHTASGQLFKKTIENDEKPKGATK